MQPEAAHPVASRLTKSQELLWAGQALSPDVPLYNMAFAFHIDGRIDPTAFQAAFARLVAECDALRMVVEPGDGTASRKTLDAATVAMPVVDLTEDPAGEAAAAAWLETRARQAFRLDRPMVDTALLRLAADRWIWFLNQHHLICDAWSVAVLFERQEALHRSLVAGNTVPTGAPVPFEAFAAREGRGSDPAIAHWRKAGSEVPGTPRLYGAPDRLTTTASRRLSLPLGPARRERLEELARRPGFRALSAELGLFQIVATVLFAWIARVSGQEALAIAAPSHNRGTPELRRAVGLLTEVFPLPVRVAGDDTFRSLFEKVRVAAASFLRFAEPGTADAAHTRGCNVILNLIRGSFGSFAGHPVRAEWLHPGHHDREHAARVHLHDFAGRGDWDLTFDLNEEAFPVARGDHARGHFLHLLDAFLADPDRPIAEVDLLDADERSELEAFNATGAALPTRTVLEDFLGIAATRPDATAIRCGDRHWSYRELAERVHANARALQAGGVEKGDKVGILRTRSMETVAAMLGVLQAGAAFVPIDPAWPAARIAYVLENAGVRHVMIEPGKEAALPAGVRALVPEAAAAPAEGADSAPMASQLTDYAYVLYTSGSTGRPKGVVIEHRALAHYVGWARGEYAAAGPIDFPLFSPLTFDLTITSIFVPLTSGGTIVVYPETGDRADLALIEVARDDLVDIIKLTPSHVRLLEQHDLSRSRVRQLILGGEGLTLDTVRRIARIFGPEVVIHNEYGPTEATVGCVVHSFPAGNPPEGAVPIGRPIANMRAWVLDGMGHPVPDGVVGELCLGGAGLAAGYLGQPEQTAERFVASTVDPGGRIYRTGDLARRNAAGLLEYCGRNDDQLKIRGARVEPGEIEAALLAHPGIEACVVTDTRRRTAPAKPELHCTRCGLPSTYPDVDFDERKVCRLCRAFDGYETRARQYFRTLDDLSTLLAETPAAGEHQCLVLFSGGKDSTYMLCRLVDLGVPVLAFTLDNGFISEQAKANIRRVVAHLGVPHMFATTPAMNRIFVDSLERHANVCQGCFKTIYTLALQEARQRGIPFIVTGLSRGQLFETRLTEELWTDPEMDPRTIDAMVLQARKAYHRVDDAVRRLLDTGPLQEDRVFEEVRILDFYRYTDVPLDEMLAYLARRVPWVRPKDTGRSTNCLINDVGIYVHQRRRGYHNYALPYSWDVRLGHKERDAALAELDDDIDPDRVRAILGEIGYAQDGEEPAEVRLVAYYEAAAELPEAELAAYLGARLPAHLVPSHFVRLDAIPLSRNGKVDRAALPEPDRQRHRGPAPYAAPRNATEETLARLWAETLRLDRVGIHDDFFKIGGDSILAIQIVARAHRAGLRLTPGDVFETLTIAGLAARCVAGGQKGTSEPRAGLVPLTPAQAWYLEPLTATTDQWNQVVQVRLPAAMPAADVRTALAALAERHDALRLGFRPGDAGWVAECVAVATVPEFRLESTAEAARAGADMPFGLGRAPLLRVAGVGDEAAVGELVLAAHHLVVDAVSWSILLEDLALALQGEPLQGAGASLQAWGAAIAAGAMADEVVRELPWWRKQLRGPAAALPLAPAEADLVAGERKAIARLDALTTRRLLDEVPRQGRIRVQELLIAAIGEALAEWTGSRSLRLWLEGHGRGSPAPDLDPTGLVGWFTSIFPVALSLPARDAPTAVLSAVKEQLRAVPRAGAGYGMLRYLGDEAVRRELAAAEEPAVVFNYLGDVDRLLAAAHVLRPTGPIELSRDEHARRRFTLEVVAWVWKGELVVELAFPSASLAAADATALVGRLVEHVRALVDHCCSTDTFGAHASDFPLASLDAAKMGKLAAALQRADAATTRGPRH